MIFFPSKLKNHAWNFTNNRVFPLNRDERVRFAVCRAGCLVALLIMGLMIPDGRAFPVFCSDFAEFPAYDLTGCATEGTEAFYPWTRSATPSAEIEEAPPVATLPTPAAERRPFLHVGPGAVDPPDVGADAERRAASPAAGNDPTQAADAPEGRNAASGLLPVIEVEGWYRMALDEDGTYLFLGDTAETPDDPTSMENEDDLLPDGIGIGKQWRF